MTQEEGWELYFAHPSIRQYIRNLPVETRVKLLRHLQRLENLGNQLREPHSRSLSRGLFELRVPGKNAQRVYYTFLPGRRIVVLQVGPKGDQRHDIEIALERWGDTDAIP